MVIFLNISVGQHVIVKVKGKLISGIVRFKGVLNGQPGRWVGVHLEYPIGNHNGCWRGNQYFKCPDKHGIFTHACNIGFHSINRKSKNSYKTRSSESAVEEELFGRPIQSACAPRFSRSISKEYLDTVKSYTQQGKNLTYKWNKETTYNKSHLVGKSIPCATISQEEPEKSKVYKRPDYFLSLNGSIPHYRMPHDAQLECLKRGDFEKKSFKQPRFLSV